MTVIVFDKLLQVIDTYNAISKSSFESRTIYQRKFKTTNKNIILLYILNFQRSTDTETKSRFVFKDKHCLIYICLGLSVNYCTIFLMPAGLYAHGPTFLGAYIIVFVIFAYPLMTLNVVLGQYHSRGPYNVLKICPLFEGTLIKIYFKASFSRYTYTYIF